MPSRSTSWASLDAVVDPATGDGLDRVPSRIELSVRVRDAAGASATVRLSDVGGLDGPHSQGIAWSILSTVRVPLTRFTGVDTTRLRTVALVQSLPQELWISDVELARD